MECRTRAHRCGWIFCRINDDAAPDCRALAALVGLESEDNMSTAASACGPRHRDITSQTPAHHQDRRKSAHCSKERVGDEDLEGHRQRGASPSRASTRAPDGQGPGLVRRVDLHACGKEAEGDGRRAPGRGNRRAIGLIGRASRRPQARSPRNRARVPRGASARASLRSAVTNGASRVSASAA